MRLPGDILEPSLKGKESYDRLNADIYKKNEGSTT